MLRYTIICLTIASLTGIGLNILSGLIENRQKELSRLTNLIEIENDRMRILEAEWAFQTQPKKLIKNAEKFLLMSNPKNKQFIQISELPVRSSAWKMEKDVSRKQIITASFTNVNFISN